MSNVDIIKDTRRSKADTYLKWSVWFPRACNDVR